MVGVVHLTSSQGSDKRTSTSTSISKQPINEQIASFLAGGLAGTVSSTLTCPLEVVKTKLQSSLDLHSANGVIRTVQEILSTEGTRGLFRGLLPTVIGILPTRSLYFWSYSSSKSYLTPILGDSSLLHVLSAAIAGVCSNTFTNPIWALKTRMQLQAGAGGYNGYPDAIRTILKTEGIRGFFRGLSASYWGVSEGAIHFVLYEKLKKYLLAYNHVRNDTEHETKLSSIQYLVAAASCKLMASAVTYPHEVVRTRMREIPLPGQLPKYRSMIQSLMLIGKEEGRKGLYAGMGPHLARVVPNTAIMFLTYETVVRWVHRYNKQLVLQNAEIVSKVASANSSGTVLRRKNWRPSSSSLSCLSFTPI